MRTRIETSFSPEARTAWERPQSVIHENKDRNLHLRKCAGGSRSPQSVYERPKTARSEAAERNCSSDRSKKSLLGMLIPATVIADQVLAEQTASPAAAGRRNLGKKRHFAVAGNDGRTLSQTQVRYGVY